MPLVCRESGEVSTKDDEHTMLFGANLKSELRSGWLLPFRDRTAEPNGNARTQRLSAKRL